MELLSSFFLPAFSGEAQNLTPAQAADLFAKWQSLIKAAKDPTLQEKWDAFLNARLTEKAAREFITYLIQAISKDLE